MTRLRFRFAACCGAVAATIVMATLSRPRAAAGAMSDCIDATCRITAPDGSRGTGCVFEISRGRVYVLTAAHVVGAQTTVQCEFWRHGHQSQPLLGSVTARVADDECDAAVVTLVESQFGGILPRAVPLAPRDYLLRAGTTVVSVGCANGSWSTGWKGHVLGYQGTELRFVPVPANGRSGSAVFDAEGEKIVGLLRARTADDSEGIATSVQTLYRAFDRDTREPQGPLPNDILPAQCPGGACPGGASPAPKWYLLPYRYKEQFRNQPQQPQPQPQQPQQPQSPAWPTLPPPALPPVDLGPTNDKLDKLIDSQTKITDLLVELRKPAEPPRPSTPPLAEPPKPAAEEAKAQAAAYDNAKAVQEQAGKLREVAEKLIGDQDTLLQRVAARREKVKAELGEGAGELDIARAYARDFAKEKLSDGILGVTSGKILGGALGLSGPLALALGGGLWLVSRRIGAKVEAGEPLLVQKLFDRIATKIDDVKDRLSDSQPNKNP